MKKYLQIIKNTWAEFAVYRLNFVLWRVRNVIWILIIYFLWRALFVGRTELFGYGQAGMLTYILLVSITRPLVMGTRTIDVGNIIHSGDLSQYLLKPIRFVRYAVSRDVADKLLNALFGVIELGILYVLLKPPVVVQTSIGVILAAFFALIIGVIIFFYFSILLSYIAFWSPDIWAPRFLSFVLAEFFTGILFPLDILPTPLYNVSISLPFSYFIYFPIKVYLGQLSAASLIQGFAIGALWMGAFWYLNRVIWRKGLRAYEAHGR